MCTNPNLLKDYGTFIVASLALSASIYAIRLSRRKTKLEIKQALLDLALTKAKDCIIVWEKESERIKKAYANEGNTHIFQDNTEEYNATISELIISREQIVNAFDLFSLRESYVSDDEKKKIIYAFWKQLSTEIRGFLASHGPVVAINRYEKRTTYSDQLLCIRKFTIHAWENKEEVTEKLYENLSGLPNIDNKPPQDCD